MNFLYFLQINNDDFFVFNKIIHIFDVRLLKLLNYDKD